MAKVLESSRCSRSRLPRPSEVTVGLTAPIPTKTSVSIPETGEPRLLPPQVLPRKTDAQPFPLL